MAALWGVTSASSRDRSTARLGIVNVIHLRSNRRMRNAMNAIVSILSLRGVHCSPSRCRHPTPTNQASVGHPWVGAICPPLVCMGNTVLKCQWIQLLQSE